MPTCYAKIKYILSFLENPFGEYIGEKYTHLSPYKFIGYLLTGVLKLSSKNFEEHYS